MIRSLFEHRSGRIVAVSRAVLAIVFFLALWIDPAQPVRAGQLGYLLIGSYLVVSVALVAVVVRSWWWDHELAAPVLVFDVLAFLSAVYFTEGAISDFTSPFLAFFTFLMLSTTLRWDWRITAMTALIVTVLYLLVGLALVWARLDFDQFRFGRRVVYMIVLSIILIWFGLQRREQHIGRFPDAPDPDAGPLPPLEGVLAFALEQSGARAGAIAWSDNEEPGIELRTMGLDYPGGRLDPQRLPDDRAFGDKARLFSRDRHRRIRASTRGRPVAVAQRLAEPLADLLSVGDALAVPFAGGTGHGEVVLSSIPGVCSDHVEIGVLIGRELQAAVDRHATLLLSHESALTRSREALARDLHDSVAQSLAGAALRLEGLRKSIKAGHDPEPEILQLKEALRSEQKQVRAMISRLRFSEQDRQEVDLSGTADRLLADLAVSWAVHIRLTAPAPIIAPVALEHEIGHILREGVANAVRHGSAKEVAVSLHAMHGRVTVEITDNGAGFPPGTAADAPRSIRERTRRYGGTFTVRSGAGGTHLIISLPLGEPA